MSFVLEQCKIKKLQVVISTHSPDIIEGMPPESIKILYESLDNGKIKVIESVNPDNAFAHIGRSFSNKKTIIVEDNCAKLIVDKVLTLIGDDKIFDVKFFPGGESLIKQENMVVYSKEDDFNHYILFDGDQRQSKIDISKLSESEKKPDQLKKYIKKIVNQEIKFNHDSGRQEQKQSLMIKYLKFHHDNVFYLPKNIPEEIIWDDIVLDKADIKKAEKEEIKKTACYKQKFNLFAKYNLGDNSSDYQEQAFKYFLKRWGDDRGTNFDCIEKILTDIKNMTG
jgi:hypothetical protein